jgi:hypothetical protein
MSIATHRDGRPKRPKPFFAQLRAVFQEIPGDALPHRHRVVLLVLADFCKPDGTGAWPMIATVAASAGLGLTLTKQTIRELEAAGWVVRAPRRTPRGTRKSTGYTLKKWGRPIVPDPIRGKRPGRYNFADAPKETH